MDVDAVVVVTATAAGNAAALAVGVFAGVGTVPAAAEVVALSVTEEGYGAVSVFVNPD